MNTTVLRKTILAGLCAAIIFLGVMIRINVPAPVGKPFIHFGNTFAVVAVMMLGFRYGAAAAMLGVGMFDILNGYAATAWLIIIEAFILAAVVAAVFKLVNYDNGKQIYKLYLVSLAAGVTKLITSWMTGVVEGLMVGLDLPVAIVNSFVSLPATLINSIATFILVPLIYKALDRTILKRIKI